jgi:hypothetical protein
MQASRRSERLQDRQSGVDRSSRPLPTIGNQHDRFLERQEVKVEPTTKLRVALADEASALDVATARVRLATGLEVTPEFQEVDRADLIVELRLAQARDRSASQLARLLERSYTGLEVLSSWQETESEIRSRGSWLSEIFSRDDIAVPMAAQRAFDDHLPTAALQLGGTGDVAYWILAVPVVGADGRMVAGVLRRNGYSHRFSALEVKAVRAQLIAGKAA